MSLLEIPDATISGYGDADIPVLARDEWPHDRLTQRLGTWVVGPGSGPPRSAGMRGCNGGPIGDQRAGDEDMSLISPVTPESHISSMLLGNIK